MYESCVHVDEKIHVDLHAEWVVSHVLKEPCLISENIVWHISNEWYLIIYKYIYKHKYICVYVYIYVFICMTRSILHVTCRMRRVTRMNESCHKCIYKSCRKCGWEKYIYTHLWNESCHTNARVKSHIWIHHVSYMNISCHTSGLGRPCS